MVVGILFILIGISYITASPSPARELALKPILQIAPIQFWGSLFVLSGLMAMISSRWPPLTETWGYMVLTGMSSGWGATFLMSIVFFHAPTTGLSQVFIWGILGFMWWAISGLLNPDKTAVTSHGRG
jgi:hypothetical protein